MSDHEQPFPIATELLTELIQAGVIVGHGKSKTHPNMKPSIAGNRNDIDLFDPLVVVESVDRAAAFLKQLLTGSSAGTLGAAAAPGLLLVVATGPAVREAAAAFAAGWKQPFVGRRWLGGTLTNFGMIKSRLRHYDELRTKRDQGELQKYTKKERLEFDKEITKLGVTFDGLAQLTRLPDALFVVGAAEHAAAVAEAHLLRIPIVAIVDTDNDPSTVSYPIMANDHARASVAWVFERLNRIVRGEEQVVREAVAAM